MCTKFGVDSSSHFPFRVQTDTQTHTHTVTDATAHSTHASATNSWYLVCLLLQTSTATLASDHLYVSDVTYDTQLLICKNRLPGDF